MLRPTLVLLLVAASLPTERTGTSATNAADTLRPGHAALAPRQVQPYTVERQLELTRGDSTSRFGRQSEQLLSDTIDGQPALLHVLTFDTPAALTVDSSWVDPATLTPRRMVSRNARRTITLEFGPGFVVTTTTPAGGAPAVQRSSLPAPAFEWNMLPVVLAALTLHEADHFVLPVFSDRAGAVVWYSVTVGADSLRRASGAFAPMWRLDATPSTAAPAAEWWVSRRHHFLDQARLAEPGVAILYARAGL